MSKKVLIFNYAGPEDLKEIGNPVREHRGPGWQQSIASLMDGLISLSGVTVFSTTPLNYGYKVPLKNSERKRFIYSIFRNYKKSENCIQSKVFKNNKKNSR